MISKLSPDEIRLRDEMAIAAMQVILHPANERIYDEAEIASAAYSMADAMLKARVLPVPADLDVSEVVKP